MSYPISPKDTNNTIQLRKKVIEKLVTNSAIYEEIDQLLTQAKDAEIGIMELMVNREKAVEAIKIPDLSHLGMFEYVVKPWHIMSKNIEQNPWWNLSKQIVKAGGSAYLAGMTATQLKDAYTTFNNPLEDDSKKSEKIGRNGNVAIGSSLFAYSEARDVYNNYQRGLKNRNLIHALHTFVIVAEKIEALCKKHGITTQFSIKSITDTKGVAMLQGLKHPRYHDKESSINS